MLGLGEHGSGSYASPIVLILGVLGVVFSMFFFLQRFGIIVMSFEITNNVYMYTFAGFTFFSGILIIFKALNIARNILR